MEHTVKWEKTTKLGENLKTLSDFKQLAANWNGNGAIPFEAELLAKTERIVHSLAYQPQIFPTARQSVQFEYHRKNGDYLEFEIFDDEIIAYSEQAGQEDERELDSPENINALLEGFYAR